MTVHEVSMTPWRDAEEEPPVFTPLDPEFKAKWLAALRSGNYKQASGSLVRLHSDPQTAEFCCLGVACDIVDPTAWSDAYNGDSRESLVRDWCDLSYDTTDSFPFIDPAASDFLATRNDSGATFEQIANWIEENL